MGMNVNSGICSRNDEMLDAEMNYLYADEDREEKVKSSINAVVNKGTRKCQTLLHDHAILTSQLTVFIKICLITFVTQFSYGTSILVGGVDSLTPVAEHGGVIFTTLLFSFLHCLITFF